MRDFLRSVEERETVLEQRGADPDWRIRVVPNAFPAFTPDQPHAYGHQDLIVEGRNPNAVLGKMPLARVREIVDVYAERTAAYMRDAKIGYIIVFRNWGPASGASIRHPHSQVYATSFVPPQLLAEARRANRHRTGKGIHPLLAQARALHRGPYAIWERGGMLAFCPPVSRFQYETWIVPLRPVDNITELTATERGALAGMVRALSRTFERHQVAYNLSCHQLVRVVGEQLVVRVTPRRTTPAGFEIDAEMYLNAVVPERAAAFLRRGVIQ